MHSLAQQSGLIGAIDRNVQLLKSHFPHHESDHGLNIAYNAMTGGTCMEDLEHKRSDDAYLDALDTTRIPDPTTTCDFCRRFKTADDVNTLQKALAETRHQACQRRNPRRVQGRLGYLIQGRMGISSAADFIASDKRDAANHEPIGQSSVARRRSGRKRHRGG